MDFDIAFATAQAEVLRRFRLTADVVDRFVQPVFAVRASGATEPEGTGLLARLDNRYYFVTAAHVLDACEYGFHFRALGAHPSLAGHHIVTGRKPGMTREDDQYDIGFVRFSESEVEIVGQANFLDLRHTVDAPPAEPPVCNIVMGYPVRDQKVNYLTGELHIQATTFMAGLSDARAYRLAKVSPQTHVLLDHRRERILYNGKTRGAPPSFVGMSGGGVWPVSLTRDHSAEDPPAFAGMVIEKPRRYGPSLLATRAGVIRRFIERFDDA